MKIPASKFELNRRLTSGSHYTLFFQFLIRCWKCEAPRTQPYTRNTLSKPYILLNLSLSNPHPTSCSTFLHRKTKHKPKKVDETAQSWSLLNCLTTVCGFMWDHFSQLGRDLATGVSHITVPSLRPLWPPGDPPQLQGVKSGQAGE